MISDRQLFNALDASLACSGLERLWSFLWMAGLHIPVNPMISQDGPRDVQLDVTGDLCTREA